MSDDSVTQTADALWVLAEHVSRGVQLATDGRYVVVSLSELATLRTAVTHLRAYAAQREKVTSG